MGVGQYFVWCMLVTGAQSTCICLAATCLQLKKKKKRERERRKKEQLAAFVPELNEKVRAGCSGSPRVLISITFT